MPAPLPLITDNTTVDTMVNFKRLQVKQNHSTE